MPLAEQIQKLIAEEPHQTTLALAKSLNIAEGTLIKLLPAEWVTVWPASNVEELLQSLAGWGDLTTIVESCGSIFEFKGGLPAGRIARGYYNLMGNTGLQGHLLLGTVDSVALLSKPLMGMESHAFVFITASGECAFKIYLGRDADRRLLPEQVIRFQLWRQAPAFSAITSL